MENVYLIVGLGNPGADFARTRHNAGFLLAERLARRWQAEWSFEEKFKARLASARRLGRKLIVCQPQTFMNESGQALARLVDYFKLPPERLLIVLDDADLPLGEIRLRARGSSGGHHGLESVEAHLATREYARLRLGIGRMASAGREITGHVLGRFSKQEAGVLESVLDRATAQVECWLEEGVGKAMSQFNGAVEVTADEK